MNLYKELLKTIFVALLSASFMPAAGQEVTLPAAVQPAPTGAHVPEPTEVQIQAQIAADKAAKKQKKESKEHRQARLELEAKMQATGTSSITSLSGPQPSRKGSGICAGEGSSADLQTICLRAKFLEAEKEGKEAVKGLRALATPSERKALGEFEKNRREQTKLAERRNEALSKAHVVGCDDKLPEISPAASISNNIGWLSPTYNVLHVFNANSVPVDIAINDGRGTIVRNLCAGGSMDIFRQYVPFVDQNYVNYGYIATGVLPNGSLGKDESSGYSISGQAYQVSQNNTWTIHLQRQQINQY